MKKPIKYSVGDLVLFHTIVGHYGSGKGTVRKNKLPKVLNQIGEIKSIWEGALYKYEVLFTYTQKNKKVVPYLVRLLESEIQPVFSV